MSMREMRSEPWHEEAIRQRERAEAAVVRVADLQATVARVEALADDLRNGYYRELDATGRAVLHRLARALDADTHEVAP